MVLGKYWAVLVDTWWHLVSLERNWLICDDTGSVEGSTGWCLVVLGRYGAVLIGSWWYWVTLERNWLLHDGTGSEEGGTC